jgi:hypothetical protein
LGSWESDGFALATSVEDSRFEGLAIPGPGAVFGDITDATLLVVPELALRQRPPQEDGAPAGEASAGGTTGRDSGPIGRDAPSTFGKRRVSNFFGLLRISGDRYGKAIKDLQLEILPHLDDPETELDITVEIRARRGSGFSDEKQRIVTENARVLKFEQADFES